VDEFAFRALVACAEEQPSDIDTALARIEINPTSALA
jgi:hypothetical protein